MDYNKLIDEVEKEGIEIIEMNLPKRVKALYGDNIIALNEKLNTNAEITCTIAEELGHYHTSSGDILDQSKVSNRQQEKRARAWSYRKLVGITKLISAYKDGVRNKYELSEYLDVTEKFITEALNYYGEKYGFSCKIDNYIIYFDPLSIMEVWE